MRFFAILFAFTVFFAQFLFSDSHQLNQRVNNIGEGKVPSEGAHQNALQMMVAAEGHRTRRHQKRAVETDAELEGQTCKIKVQKVKDFIICIEI